jgi:hypothetical protein
MGAFFGAKLAAQARLHARQVKAMELIAAHMLPVVNGWDQAAFARALEPQVAMA